MVPDSIDEIQRLLGRQLEPDRQASIVNLNEMPAVLIEEARKLPSILSYIFLRYYVEPSSHPYLKKFIEDVVQGDKEASRWHLGRILVPSFSVRELLTLDISSIISKLHPRPDEDWKQIPPNRDLWDAREFLTGAPAVLRPTIDYRAVSQDHVIDLLLDSMENLNSVTDINIATRRWVASNLAGAIVFRGLLGTEWNPQRLISMAFPKTETISHDTMIAIKGFLKEEQYLGPNDSEVPGFRGPDVWYSDSSSPDP